MMYIIIILAVLGVAFLVFKNKIKEFITKRIKEKNKIKDEIDDFVFIPVGMTRQFNISFIIEEVGGGKAKIIIQKSSL